MADASRTVDIIFRGQNQLGAGVASVEQSLGGIGEEASEAEGKVDDLNQGINDLGGSGQDKILSLKNAFVALAGSIAVKEFLDANIAAQSFLRTLEYSTGSAEEAAKEYEYIREVSNRLGLEFSTTAESYAKFSSQIKGSAVEGEGARKIFEAIAGTLSAVGASSQDLSGALFQLGQGIGRNRFELEDLKGIAERIPGGMFAIAESLGLTTDELYKQISAGKLGGEQMVIYADALQNKLGGVTFDALQNRLNLLNNSFNDVLVTIGEAGAIDQLATGFTIAAQAVGLLNEALDYIGSDGSTLASFTTGLGPLFTLINNFDPIKNGIADYFSDANDQLQEIEVTAKRMPGILTEIVPQGQYIEGTIVSLDKYSAALDKTATEGAKAALELEKIASNERIRNFEAKISLDIAEVEASAKKVESAFESINVGIESTGDLLNSLFDNLGEADSFRELFQIEDQIKLENERRTKELELQEKLTKATISELKARQQMMKSGGALITVNGDGLQPHLEAFMWEILEAIQVRVNADGYEMLLGGP